MTARGFASVSSLLALALAATAPAAERHDRDSTPADGAAIACTACEAWNARQPPFRLHGGAWYVGTRGLASVLIDTGAGLILLDGGLPQSAERILENLHALGLDPSEIVWIAVSHAHFDHAGGVAALARGSGAQVLASPRAAEGLRSGTAVADDPQAGLGEEMRFPPVVEVRELADGESLSLGDTVLIAHHTPGHTPGGTSWTWRECEGKRCLDMVYADSLSAVSAPGYVFSAGGEDGAGAVLRRSIGKVRTLPCDLMVATHPDFTGLFEALAERERGRPDALIDPDACRRYADAAESRLQARLAQERADGRVGAEP